MNYLQIENESRRLLYEIWLHRNILFPSGASLLQMCSPEAAARVLQVEYEVRPSIAPFASGQKAAGQLDAGRGVISVSAEFPYEVQRFTGAHEAGHLMLHDQIGNGIAHREMPIGYDMAGQRPLGERQADYFAATFLAPRRLFTEAFQNRFGHAPLHLDENVAFYLAGKDARKLMTEPPGSLLFGMAVAKAQWLGGPRFHSLSTVFGLSPKAIAIRLRELELIAD